MKKIIACVVILVGLTTQVAYGQNYSFRVLANKGQNKVKKAGTKWVTLKTGTRLSNGDRLKLATNSYLGLVHISGKTLELKEAGSYDITTLSDKLGANSKSMVSKYADFVISKMAPEEIERNRKKYASVTGSGERGLYDTDIHIYLPKTVTLLNYQAIISWDFKEKNADFIILVKNIFGDVILNGESSSRSFSIDYNDNSIKERCINNIITIEVRLKNKAYISSQEVAVRILDETEASEIKARKNELESYLGKSSPLNNLILAGFYEENGLILDAITSYEDAVLLSPDVEYFKEVYDEFLIRNELKKPE